MGQSEVTPEMRALEIATEESGNFYYGRRYFVEKTRFWGYVRKPRQPWSKAQLVVMNEDSVRQPDRLPEDGPSNARHGYDQNSNYRITGHFTGRKIYEPASNLFLPEFKATGYRRIDTNGGWLFTPQDYYNKTKITLVNETVSQPTR
ncbi:hypothetical protein ACFSW8_04690 [Rubritalea tangerina]|uniref:Uncharacterized protein n=2 Tax=Rubritalea tangerina TaxID=430798 RepID=A0ABW4Z878_9BACT